MKTRRKIGYLTLFLLLGAYSTLLLGAAHADVNDAIALVAAQSEQEQPIVGTFVRSGSTRIDTTLTGNEVCELTAAQLKNLQDQYEVKTQINNMGGKTIMIATIKGDNLNKEILVSKVGDFGNCIVVKNRHSVIVVSPVHLS